MTRLLDGRMALVFAVAVVLAGCNDSREPGETPPVTTAETTPSTTPNAPDTLTVLYVGGDVLPASSMRRSVRAGDEDEAHSFAEIFAGLSTRIAGDHPSAFLLVNLETPVAEARVANDAFRHLKTGEGRVPAPLNAPGWIVHGLARAGVDAVMLANNHTLDQGREGLAETVRAARDAGLVVTGAGFAPNLRWPITIGEDGATIAILSYIERDFPEPMLEDGEPGVSVYTPGSLTEVRAARRHHEAVVVVLHVVAELETRIKPSWRTMARDLANAGADVVAIHGQHVPAPVETIRARDGRDVVVAFGLGNLLSDMGSRARPGRDVPEEENKLELPEASEGLLLRVEVGQAPGSGSAPARDRVRVGFVPIFVANTRYLVYNRAIDGPPTFHVLPLSPCGAIALPEAWPEPFRSEMAEWIGARRQHLLAATELVAACDAAEAESDLLRAASFRGTL